MSPSEAEKIAEEIQFLSRKFERELVARFDGLLYAAGIFLCGAAAAAYPWLGYFYGNGSAEFVDAFSATCATLAGTRLYIREERIFRIFGSACVSAGGLYLFIRVPAEAASGFYGIFFMSEIAAYAVVAGITAFFLISGCLFFTGDSENRK